MVEPINLNRARKGKAKAASASQAAANRVKFGRTGGMKAADRMDAAQKAAALDGAKRDD